MMSIPVARCASSPSAGVAKVEVRGARRRLPCPPSRPIPVKKCSADLRASAEEATCVDRTSEYDWLTWRMYTRITTARRLRAHAFHGVMQDSMSRERAEPQVHPIVNARDLQPPSSSEDELLDDEVFILDPF